MQWKRVAAVLATAGLIVNCGGGGGGGGGGTPLQETTPNTGGNSSAADIANPPGDTSGLLIASSASGEVLAGDATAYRPLVANGVWSYRGRQTYSFPSTPVVYSHEAKQTTVAAGLANEALSNAGNEGADIQSVTVNSGVVAWNENIDISGKGLPGALTVTQLKSPVRRGDLYIALDRRYNDTDIDADGDGKADAIDVAIYAIVAGIENVDLENAPSVSAIRVETKVRTRVRYSSTGLYSPIIEGLQINWYANGIGVVRRLSEAPYSSGTAIRITDERLMWWHGGDRGFGPLPEKMLTAPPSSASLYPSGTVYLDSFLVHSVPFEKHGLLFTNNSNAPGSVVLRIDQEGKLDRFSIVHGFSPTATLLAGHRNGVLLLKNVSDSSEQFYGITRFNSDGDLLGTVNGSTIDLGSNRFAPQISRVTAAADDGVLWVAWVRRSVSISVGIVVEQVLRAYDFDGNPKTAEMLLGIGDDYSFPAISIRQGTVLVTWIGYGPEYPIRYVTSSVSGSPVVRVLTNPPTSPRGVFPISLTRSDILVSGPSKGGIDGVSSVRLDSQSLPIFGPSGGFQNELLPGVFSPDKLPMAVGSRISLFSSGSAKLWPEDSSTQRLTTVQWRDLGDSGRLVDRGPWLQARVPGFSDNPVQIPLDDRILVVKNSGVSIVWTRSSP